MWLFIEIVGFLATIVFVIMGVIAKLRKKKTVKKNFIIAGACFVLFIIGTANVGSQETDTPKTASVEATTPPVSAEPTTTDAPIADPTAVPSEKPVVAPVKEAPFDITLPFDKFTKAYYALTAEEQTRVFTENLKDQSITWTGTVIETGSSNIYIYGLPSKYKGESWADISSGDDGKISNVIVTKISDKTQLDGVNPGDSVTIQAKFGSRGAKGKSHWKLVDGSIIKHTVANKPTITKAEYAQIKNGMSYKEVTKIIGGPGEVLSESGDEGSEFYTIMVMYEGEGKLGANANMMFQGDKLMNKAQMGLE